jgi:hypothetical protein
VTNETSSSSIIPNESVISSDDVLLGESNSSFDSLIDTSTNSTEKIPSVLLDTLSSTERAPQRTYVILTELDEPFFGPYPIEFTITI